MLLDIGDPLPEDSQVLPDPDQLEEEVCCTVAAKTEGGRPSSSLLTEEREKFDL